MTREQAKRWLNEACEHSQYKRQDCADCLLDALTAEPAPPRVAWSRTTLIGNCDNERERSLVRDAYDAGRLAASPEQALTFQGDGFARGVEAAAQEVEGYEGTGTDKGRFLAGKIRALASQEVASPEQELGPVVTEGTIWDGLPEEFRSAVVNLIMSVDGAGAGSRSADAARDRLIAWARSALPASPARGEAGRDLLASLRGDGWAVAVHNDYRLDGVPCTFWLLTRGDRCVKGEARMDEGGDAAALEKIREALASAPAPTPEPRPEPHSDLERFLGPDNYRRDPPAPEPRPEPACPYCKPGAPCYADDPRPDPATACPSCKGRGWHPGDCHPREECGTCEGTGRKPCPHESTTSEGNGDTEATCLDCDQPLRWAGGKWVTAPAAPPSEKERTLEVKQAGCTDGRPCLKPFLRWVHSAKCREQWPAKRPRTPGGGEER